MYSLQEQKRESVYTIGSALQRACQVTSYNFELSRGDVESNHGNGFRTIHSQVLFCDLYVLRLVIRVEGYMMYVIQNDEWRRSDRKDSSGTGASSSVRGLECTEANVSLIRSSAERIRRCIDGYAFPMLERWARHLLDSDNMLDSCTVRIWSLEFGVGVWSSRMPNVSLTHSLTHITRTQNILPTLHRYTHICAIFTETFFFLIVPRSCQVSTLR